MNKSLRANLILDEFREYIDTRSVNIEITSKKELTNVLKALYKLSFSFSKYDRTFSYYLLDYFYEQFYNTPPYAKFTIIIEFYIKRDGMWVLEDYCLDYLYVYKTSITASSSYAIKKLKKIHIELKNNG